MTDESNLENANVKISNKNPGIFISSSRKIDILLNKEENSKININGTSCPSCGNGNIGTGSPGERLVNDPAQDLPVFPLITQSETSLAYFDSFILFGFNDSNDFVRPVFQGLGYAFSSDGGTTWCDCGTLSKGDLFADLSDPVIAVDREGNFYYARIAVTKTTNPETGEDEPNEFVVVVSTAQVNNIDRTLQVNNPFIVGEPEFPNNGLDGGPDKEWITVGPDKLRSGQQALYITWTDFSPQDIPEISTIRFSKFTTGSTPSRLIMDTTIAHTTSDKLNSYLQGSFPVVDSSGNIYVFYEQTDITTDPQIGAIYMVKSTDGGINFDAPMLIAPSFPVAQNFFDPEAGPSIKVDDEGKRIIRMNDSPHSVIAPDDTIYVVWNSGENMNTTGIDIFLAYSRDGGNTWNKVQITNSKAHEFFPSVTFNCGKAQVQYSRFNDPQNTGGVGDGTFALFKKSFTIPDMLSSESMVSAAFSPVPITNPNFDPTSGPGYMGDYNQIIAGPGNLLYHAWGDNRNTLNDIPNPDVFFIQTECVPAPTSAPCQCCFGTLAPVNFEHCELEKTVGVTATVNCVGRALDVNVTLKNVCPNKFVNIGVLIYEGTNLIAFKVCKFSTDSTPGTCIPSVNAGKFCFIFDDDSCPPARTLNVRVVANYVER